MRDFTLGIIGGCLTHQVGVPKSELYHQRLKRMLAEEGGINLKVRIARDFTEEHSVRLDALLNEYTVDAVLIHVRNYNLGRSVLITKSVTDEEFRYHLHPFLLKRWQTGWAKIAKSNFAGQPVIFRRRNTLKNRSRVEMADRGREPEALDATAEGADLGARRFLGVSLRGLFFAVGAVVGLEAWTVRDELQMLLGTIGKCRQVGLPVLVLGPGRTPSDYWKDRICQKLDKRLSREMRKLSVPYCGISDSLVFEGHSVYSGDGWHMSATGHGYVATELRGTMTSWLGAVDSSCETAFGGKVG
jgi:hypothetical protein